MQIINCHQCGKPFEGEHQHTRFCSRVCSVIFQGGVPIPFRKKCKYCRKPFESLARSKEYCSDQCRNEHTAYIAHGKSEMSYFVEGAGLVKIGKTIDISSRLPALQACSPVKLTLLALVQQPEELLHARFAHLRQHGEWFTMNDEIKDFLDQVENVEVHRRDCEFCRLPFIPRRGNQRFCSESCRKRKFRDKS